MWSSPSQSNRGEMPECLRARPIASRRTAEQGLGSMRAMPAPLVQPPFGGWIIRSPLSGHVTRFGAAPNITYKVCGTIRSGATPRTTARSNRAAQMDRPAASAHDRSGRTARREHRRAGPCRFRHCRLGVPAAAGRAQAAVETLSPWWKLTSADLIAAFEAGVAILSAGHVQSLRGGVRWIWVGSGWLIDAVVGGLVGLVSSLDWIQGLQRVCKTVVVSIRTAVALVGLLRCGASTDRSGAALAAGLSSAGEHSRSSSPAPRMIRSTLRFGTRSDVPS